MKQIQWYPGHMNKALREVEEKLKLVDIAFILVDARIPYSSMNPKLDNILKNKLKIILFNKIDLADIKEVNKWARYYENKGYTTLNINSINGFNLDKIEGVAKEVLKEKLERNKKRGLKERKIRAMILGIPNVGKSTLINKLAKRKAAVTGDRPGVTKAQQWIKLASIDLLDTPGVLWPKFESNTIAFNLAACGAIKDTILPLDEVCIYSLKFLNKHYQKLLFERFKLKELNFDNIEKIYNDIGRLRGCIMRGNEVDYDKVSTLILHDLRHSKLGRITLDREEDLFND